MTTQNILEQHSRYRRACAKWVPAVVLSIAYLLMGANSSDASSNAITVTHTFGGVVTSVSSQSEIADASAVGERFEFSVTYDTRIQGIDSFFPVTPVGSDPTGDLFRTDYRAQTRLHSSSTPDSPVLEFVNPPTTYELTLGGETIDRFSGLPDTFSPIELQNYAFETRQDVSVFNNSPLSPPGVPPNFDAFSFLHVLLVDSTQSVFSDTSLPLQLQLADFDTAELRFIESVGLTRLFTISGTIDQVTSTAVIPEPGIAMLLGLGLIMLRSYGGQAPAKP